MIKTILITNDPLIAADAQAAGVSRIMVDLESHGKKERQASRNTFISTHTPDDVGKIRAVIDRSELIVRINPMHYASSDEINRAVDDGADIIMLPMITRMIQLEDFLTAINGRARPLPLVETGYSMAHIADIAEYNAIEELYIGLNDLHLSLGLDFLFEPLALGLIDWMATKIHQRGKAFGFGGIARMGQGELPAERILGEHVRLGSSCVILSSRFCKDVHIENPAGRRERMTIALEEMQAKYAALTTRNTATQRAESEETFTIIRHLANPRL